MDFRRFHSSSLVDSGSGSRIDTDKTSAKLPLLWRNIKSKLNAFGSGRKQPTSQISSPRRDSASATPPDSPGGLPITASHLTAALAAANCDADLPIISSNQPASPAQQRPPRLLLPPCAPTAGPGPTALASSSSAPPLSNTLAALAEATASTPGGRNNDAATASPKGICAATESISGPLPALPSIQQSPASSRSPRAQEVAPESVAEPPMHSLEGGLLGISPVLPTDMRRSIWSLADFAVIKRLHKSTTSSVYRAICRRSGVPVALKVYFLSRVAANVLHMLKREIEIHTGLVHKHCARLYAAFLDGDDRVVLVQEYAAQGDLYGVLQRLGGRMHHEQVADCVMRPFLEALSYLHSKGVCHRDIKPENILFTGSWRLLIADFGVSINLNRERAVTRAGTEGYMAPEVERCPLKTEPHENKDDPRYAYSTAVDIWAVGVLAYELMVGFPPVVAMSTPAGSAPAPACAISSEAASESLCGFVQNHMTAASLHFPASVPPAARSFVLAALCPDPLERPTAAQLLTHAWLQREQTGRSAGATPGSPSIVWGP